MCGMKDRYDLAFSIGGACACSQALRRAGMQYASYPFDWVVGTPIDVRAHFFESDFADWIPRNALKLLGSCRETRKDIYQNKANGMVFNHDFPCGAPFEDAYGVVCEKYRRRKNRLISEIRCSKSVLIVYLQVPNEPRVEDAVIVRSLERIRSQFQGVEFDLLVISQLEGRRFTKKCVRRVCDGLFRVDFDYATPGKGYEYVANDRKVARVLRKLVRKVRDRRSAEEKSSYRIQRRQKEFQKFHASGLWECLVNKLTWRLYKHFKNNLERKGFEFDD